MNESKLALLCVTTCKRPRMLDAALASLERAGVADGWTAKMLVLDNDSEATARPVFEARVETSAFPIRYAVEPRRGISAVRNRAIDEALSENADALVFFDDDQVAHPDCLRFLLEDMEKSGADIINGFVSRVWPGGVRPWWAPKDRRPSKNGMEKTDACATNLTAFARRVISQARFDEQFSFIGFGDIEYTRRATRAGFAVFHADRARADESVPPSRASFRGCVKMLWGGNVSQARIRVKESGRLSAFANLAPKGLAKIGKGVLLFPLIPFSPRKFAGKVLKNIVAGAGMFCGACAFRGYEKYRRIEGD